MPMGRERAVLRWDVREALLRDELARVEGELAALAAPDGPPERRTRADALERERQQTLSHLRALGPSPRAKMG